MKGLILHLVTVKALFVTALSVLFTIIAFTQTTHCGFASLRVNQGAVRANCTSPSLTAGTNCNLSYWLKTEPGTLVKVRFATRVQGVNPVQPVIYNSDVVAGGYALSTALDTNWHYYSAIIIPKITSNIFAFGIDCRPVTSDFYLNDVVLVADGSTANRVADLGFETAFQSHFKGEGTGWPTANWVDLSWMSEYAWQVHQCGHPNGPKALYIEGTLVPRCRTLRAVALNSIELGNRDQRYQSWSSPTLNKV